jgi:hypothetical protein
MNPLQYLARNHLRNSQPDYLDLDEFWEDDIEALRHFMAGAERILQELHALEVPNLDELKVLLNEHFEDDEAFFLAYPTEPEDIFGGGLLVQIRDGKSEPLAAAPCSEEYRRKISTTTFASRMPAMYSMAFRMLQEFYGRSPDTVMKLAPLLVEHLLENHSPQDGIRVSFAEVVDFCDRMISQGRVTLENIPFPFIQSDEEEDKQPPPPKPPEDDLPF